MVAQASVAHDVQTITMALQPAASRLTQRITFTAIDCPTGTNCMTDAFYNTSMYSPPSTPNSYHNDAIPWSKGLGAPINAPGRCAGVGMRRGQRSAAGGAASARLAVSASTTNLA